MDDPKDRLSPLNVASADVIFEHGSNDRPTIRTKPGFPQQEVIDICDSDSGEEDHSNDNTHTSNAEDQNDDDASSMDHENSDNDDDDSDDSDDEVILIGVTKYEGDWDAADLNPRPSRFGSSNQADMDSDHSLLEPAPDPDSTNNTRKHDDSTASDDSSDYSSDTQQQEIQIPDSSDDDDDVQNTTPKRGNGALTFLSPASISKPPQSSSSDEDSCSSPLCYSIHDSDSDSDHSSRTDTARPVADSRSDTNNENSRLNQQEEVKAKQGRMTARKSAIGRRLRESFSSTATSTTSIQSSHVNEKQSVGPLPTGDEEHINTAPIDAGSENVLDKQANATSDPNKTEPPTKRLDKQQQQQQRQQISITPKPLTKRQDNHQQQPQQQQRQQRSNKPKQPSQIAAPQVNLEAGRKKSEQTKRIRRSSRTKNANEAVNNDDKEENVRGDNDSKKRKRQPDTTKRRSFNVDDFRSMTIVEKLSSLAYSSEGLPIQRICVHGVPDHVLYYFKLEVRQSKIPNSGYGAFVTLEAVRELPPSARYYAERLWEDHSANDQHEALQAKHHHGFGMSVTITGEQSTFERNLYPLRTLEATLPNKKEFRLKLTDPALAYNEAELKGMQRNKQNRSIGFLGIFEEEDYLPASHITFSSLKEGCGMIQIGRYAPFRKEDRKPKDLFDLKSFIFDNEPGEWGFDVDEKLNGQDQYLDITSDVTGEPHFWAKRHIPMYVNEVGHDPNLKQTVYSNEDEHGRNVLYFLLIADDMKVGDTIEALVDYQQFYEDIRERKGYGRANLAGSVHGDDHFPSKLQRDFSERTNVEKLISDLSIMGIFALIEAIEFETRVKIVEFVTKFTKLSNLAKPPFTAQQIVALRRIAWLEPLLTARIASLSKKYNNFQIIKLGEVQQQASAWLHNFKASSFECITNYVKERPSLKDSKGRSFHDVLYQERIVEQCFGVKTQIINPLDDSLWCGIGRALIIDMCNIFDSRAKVREGANDKKTRRERAPTDMDYVSKVVDRANMAAELIRDFSKIQAADAYSTQKQDIVDSLSFRSKAKERQGPVLGKDLTVGAITPNLLQRHTTIPKGEINARCNLQAYEDAVHLGVEPLLYLQKVRLAISERLIMVASQHTVEPTIGHKRSTTVGIPRPLSWKPCRNEILAVDWYIIWQVIFIVHSFSNKNFDKASGYSLELLCHEMGMDPRRVASLIVFGIQSHHEYIDPRNKSKRAKQERKKSHKKSRRMAKGEAEGGKGTNSKPRLSYNNLVFWGVVWVVLEGKLGWHKEMGNRPNDFYACPPGVRRGRGFSPRVDFFDSVPLVMEFLAADSRWKDREEIRQCLRAYHACVSCLAESRAKKVLPKFTEKGQLLAWLLEQTKQKQN